MRRVYTVHGLDVWGSIEDGTLYVNNVLPSQGTIELEDMDTDEAIASKLIESRFLVEALNLQLFSVSSDEGVIWVDYEGYPVLELREIIKGDQQT